MRRAPPRTIARRSERLARVERVEEHAGVAVDRGHRRRVAQPPVAFDLRGLARAELQGAHRGVARRRRARSRRSSSSRALRRELRGREGGEVEGVPRRRRPAWSRTAGSSSSIYAAMKASAALDVRPERFHAVDRDARQRPTTAPSTAHSPRGSARRRATWSPRGAAGRARASRGGHGAATRRSRRPR